MEGPPYPQAPLYLESYMALVDAARHPADARAEAVDMFDCNEKAAEALLPDLSEPEKLQVALAEPLINSLLTTARDFGITGEELDDDDVALMRSFHMGAWWEAGQKSDNLDCQDVANPLEDESVIRQLWQHAHDHRCSLPAIEQLLPY